MTTDVLAAQKSIDKMISDYKLANGTTSKHIAKTLGITTASLSNKRSGKFEWKQSELVKLSEMFGVTIDDLISENA